MRGIYRNAAHGEKKVLDILDSGMLQLFVFARLGAQGRHQTIVRRGLTLAVNIIVFLVLSLNPVFTRPHLCATIPVKVWDYMWDQSWAS